LYPFLLRCGLAKCSSLNRRAARVDEKVAKWN
jgi:hypothetical protein